MHIPAMLSEVVELLGPKPGKTIVDCTLGMGGHAKTLLQKGASVIGLDQDSEALQIAQKNLKGFANSIIVQKGNFRDIESLVKKKVDGFLLDLGVSSYQIDTAGRGFSLRLDGPLDMRMDQAQNKTALDIISQSSEYQLGELLKTFGEVKLYKKISRAISNEKNISSTAGLKSLLDKILAFLPPKTRLDETTRVFQALRIATNQELEALAACLNKIPRLLKKKGRIAVISYHSLEDRIVKQFFRDASKDCLCPGNQLKCTCAHKKSLILLTKKPLTPKIEEVQNNTRSRSAKLRAAEKL